MSVTSRIEVDVHRFLPLALRSLLPLSFAAFVVLGLLAPGVAKAFQVASGVTTNCHERISKNAVEEAGWPGGDAPPSNDDYHERISEDLPTSIAQSMDNPWGLALLIGSRHPDIGKFDPSSLSELVALHNDPELQPAHCLREKNHDGLAGNAQAIEECKNFILDELALALGEGGEIDFDATEVVPTYLAFRGTADLKINRFAFHTGRALHALQDSFTHTFRSRETVEVNSVMNWLEGNVESEQFDEEEDGHPHVSALDDCNADTEGASFREREATAASAALLHAINLSEGAREGRLARARSVLDERIALTEEECTVDNDYCDSPALAEVPSGGCSIAHSASWLSLLAVAASLLFLGYRRRSSKQVVVGASAILVVFAFQQQVATAQGMTNGEEDARRKETLDRQEGEINAMADPITYTWGLALSGGVSYDEGAANLGIGLRYNPLDWLSLGLDAEYNPWVATANFERSNGAFNLYAPIAFRLKRFGAWEMRSSVALGLSRINERLVGVDEGSVGPYVAVNPLGVAIPMGNSFKLIVKPGEIAVPIPQTSGIPFYYRQYRYGVTLEWYPSGLF